MPKETENAENSSMDLMSCLIGCLILILIGILLIIMVSQALVIVANPEKQKLQALELAQVEGIQEDKAFPHGNKLKEPVYFDVHRDKIVIFPGEVSVPVRALEEKGNPIEQEINRVSREKDEEYIVLLIRPRAAELAQHLRKVISDKKLIDLGMELIESNGEIAYNDGTRKLLLEKRAQERAARKGEAPPPVAKPSLEITFEEKDGGGAKKPKGVKPEVIQTVPGAEGAPPPAPKPPAEQLP